MTFTDYLLDIALIAIVVFQIRGRRLTTRSLVLPLAIVGRTGGGIGGNG
ncbi:MAG: hypothetical protein ABSG81_07550 [Acidimicrobiales bacterium]|jgi:hypothetical protein